MNRPFRILVADDEKPVAAGLQGQLDALGYDVVGGGPPGPPPRPAVRPGPGPRGCS